MKKAPRRKIVDELMAEHIHMPGFPQIVVTRSFAYQYLKKLGWPELGPHGSGLDYSVLAVARKTDEPLTDPEVRDYHLSAPEVVKGLSHNPAHGIQFVLGIHDRRPHGPRGGTTELQSVMFDKDVWSKPDAARWLKEHDLKSALVESQANFWRFQQKPSKQYERFSVIEAGHTGAAANPRQYELGSSTEFSTTPPDERGEVHGPWMRGLRGSPIEILQKQGRGKNERWLVEIDQAGQKLYGWVYRNQLAPRGTLYGNPARRSGTGRGNPDAPRYIAAEDDWPLLTAFKYTVMDTMTGHKVAFGSHPHLFKQKFGAGWLRYRTLQAAQKAAEKLNKTEGQRVNPCRSRNPASAATLYEEFHGQPPDETLEFRDKIREHDQLAELGALVEMKIRTLTKLAATLRFDGDAPLLCSSPDGRQLYLQGGDQSLDLHSLKMDGEEWRKDSMTIGVIDELTYGTAKKFHHFRMQDYYHRLGEESGVQPFLLYDPVNKLMAVTGGQYRTGEPGIEN